jgi:adenine-specific DNA-methyltransferase
VQAGKTPQTLWRHTEVGNTQDAKKALLKYVPFEHTENVLNSVKPVELIQRVLQLATDPAGDDIVLDFFSGSGTTAHAVLKQNAEDGGHRRFIAVQVQEKLPKPEPTFDSILGMSLTRIKNVAQELREQLGATDSDHGYRRLTIDTTNMADVLRTPDATGQQALNELENSVKPGRSGDDLLFQVLLDWGLELTMPVTVEQLEGREVFVVDDEALIACFDSDVSPELVRAIAKREPLRAVFRDSGFASDDARINAEQIFREISPATDVKAI